MQELDDHQLLAAYAREQSGEAFATLVERYVNLVYSAGWRCTGNAQAAEEISQAVFIILAQKASTLGPKTILAGWLYHTARLTAANYLRAERRRQRREQEAYMQSLANENPDPDQAWQQVGPLLDEALGTLGTADRDAVVLRYFQNKSAREIAEALRVELPTAHKRVERAVGKLRKFFLKRGVTLSAAAIAGAVTANSVQAAPAGLAKTISTVAMVKGATASASTLTLVKGALKIMAWSNTKTVAVTGMAVLLAAAATTVTVKEVYAQEPRPWQVEGANFSTFYKQPAEVEILPTKFGELTNAMACADSTRGGLGLNVSVAGMIAMAYKTEPLRMVIATELPVGKYDFIAKLVGPNMRQQNTNWAEAFQRAITKKFGVIGRMEMIDTNVMVLQPTAGGVHGFKVSHTMPHGMAVRAKSGDYAFYEQPMSTLIGHVQQHMQLPIVDKSDLLEEYDFSLKWDETDPKNPNPESMRWALHDQLGLDLVATNMPIEMLVVEKMR